MKTVIASILALTVAAPAFAGAKDVEAHFAQDNTGIESVVVERSSPVTAEAVEIFTDLAAEAGTGIETQANPVVGATLSSKGGVNPVAAAWFAGQLASENASDR
ncbi:hypothetical protein [Halocynthiibacter styelae]|uniref:Uncharacterized protein n=1 Tax=Halocynthiibacter styelae TaxID=2761955 RepID=A0A8J7ILL2_9RHOB|nr:hypothetical protein [Paenihalocynthiibacter styelae]MBI1492616.1 hypothetical protein [Paenihalocynthiibacter styelae]